MAGKHNSAPSLDDPNAEEEAQSVEYQRLDYARTGNPLAIWRAILALTHDRDHQAKPPEVMGEALARLPPEMCAYLAEAALRITKLSHGLDWREVEAELPNEVPANALSHVMGLSPPPPLSPTQAANLLGTALGLVRKGGNSFSDNLSDWRAHVAALRAEEERARLGEADTRERTKLRREGINRMMEQLGVSDERSLWRLLSKGRKSTAQLDAATKAPRPQKATDRTSG